MKGKLDMTCAKAQVECTIVSADGFRRYVGTNACAQPQDKCPREPGEGYEKCKTVCHQAGHAEEVALDLAGKDADGATAVLRGHTHFCGSCQRKLFEAGVAFLRLGTKGDGSDGMYRQ